MVPTARAIPPPCGGSKTCTTSPPASPTSCPGSAPIEEARAAQIEIARGNKLFPVQTVFCVRGRDLGDWDANEADLFERIREVEALLSAHDLETLHEKNDLVGLDTYLQALDVAAALAAQARQDGLDPESRARIRSLADALGLFCSPGSLEARLFNRPGQLWPEADVTIFEMGVLVKGGYEDKLNVAVVGLLNHIHTLVERCQYQNRPTLVLIDEAHLITTNPLLAPYVVKITKMWRSFGAWLWLATQNMQDFPDASKRMLNMLEWWLCMSMPPKEAEQIARFRDLTPEERALLLAAGKEPGRYTEGVILTPHLKALFRNVPPTLALALAMTEQDEKAERAAIMKANRCSELEAALIVAERLAAQRRRT
jgi:hypothetical protein